MKVGQSFEINGDTPNYQAKSLAPAAYAVASYVERLHISRKIKALLLLVEH